MGRSFLRAAAVLVLTIIVATLAPTLAAQAPVGSERRLTTSGGVVGFAWAPDGSRIVFTRSAEVVPSGTGWQTLSDLRQVPAAGGEPALLARNAAEPVFAPGGDALAYLSFESGGQGRVHVLAAGVDRDLGAADFGRRPAWDAAGAAVTVLRDGEAVTFDRQGRVVVGLQAAGAAAAGVLSPDGTRLASVVFAEATSELWVAFADGSGRTLLLRGELEIFGRPAWSPDGSLLVLSRTPTGSETASYGELWLVPVDGSGPRRLTWNEADESLPAFSPGGDRIAFVRGGDLWLRGLLPDPEPVRSPITPLDPATLIPPPAFDSLLPVPEAVNALTPPATIRVIHSAKNTCRPGVPVNQIDVFGFEDQYLKWVVPTEVPASWPPEAVKAQAVAARTYAWLRVLTHGGWTYDVTDWTEYQAMCPNKQNVLSDAAVDATRGQYLSDAGSVANAMYSAENSDPTRSYPGVSYMTGVDDPVGFGKTLYGHGYGLSQWGAYRWGAWYGWSYQQILAHYYTGITIQLPAGEVPDTRAPLAGPLLPWPNWYVNSNRTLLTANASDDASGVAAIAYTARYSLGSVMTTTVVTPLVSLASLPEQPGIQVTVTVRDVSGNTGAGTAVWGLDRFPPFGSAAAPTFATVPTVTLTLSATDAGFSGLLGAVVSSDWRWEAETDVGHSNSAAVSDTAALNGTAWMAAKSAGSDRWYGPAVTLGPGGYRAWFRLRAADVFTTSEVVFLEVIDDGACDVYDPSGGCQANQYKRLGLKRVRGIDFRQAGEYHEFFVDFTVTSLVGRLQFPVWYRGTSDLWYDRLIVTSYPISTTSLAWPLLSGDGLKRLQVKYTDRAGNVSADIPVSVTLDTAPPVFVTPDLLPWSASRTPTVTVTTRDLGSGLDGSAAAYRHSVDGGATWASAWLPAVLSHTSGLTMALVTAPAVPFGQDSASQNRVEFRVADLAGRTTSLAYTVPVDTVAPSAAASAPEWVPGAVVTVTWSGADAVSGVATYDLEVRENDGLWRPWITATTAASAVFTGATGTIVEFRARATDQAGNTGDFGNGDAQTALGAEIAGTNVGRGWTLIGLPLRPVVTMTAESLLQSIDAAGGSAQEIAAWQGGGWSSHLIGIPANDFTLELGRGYFVRGEAPGSGQYLGFVGPETITRSLEAGWNLVSVPQGLGPYTAESLAAGMRAQGGSVRYVLQWRAGSWSTHVVGQQGTGFPIEPGRGYFVYCDHASQWQP